MNGALSRSSRMFYSKLTKTAGAGAALLRAGRLGRRIDGEKTK